MAPKAKRKAETAGEKRYREAIDGMAVEFLCPITQELPLDPVTAEDGRVYERRAIENWLDRQRGSAKSPITNGYSLKYHFSIQCIEKRYKIARDPRRLYASARDRLPDWSQSFPGTPRYPPS